jgi:mycothiol synthase
MESDTHIRKFVWQDTERITWLFYEINGLTHTEKEFDVNFMRQYLSQPSCDPENNCFLADIDGNSVGFILVAPELKIGRAVASGGVLEAFRDRGIERRLLKKAVKHATAIGADVLHVERSVEQSDNHAMLECEGFHKVRQYWQMRWEGNESPPMSLPEGFWLRSFTVDEDEETLVDLQNTAFGENWGFAPNTVDEISARVSLDRSSPDGIIFVVDGDRPIAYNWTLQASNSHKSVGWVAMTGVHPDYRGMGLGRTVVIAGMEYLVSQGVDGIELEVDSANTAARELYLKLGFEKVSETVWFEKSLKD